MPANERPIEVLIVDDHPVVRRGLVALLSAEPGIKVVAEAASGEEALTIVDAIEPDVVLCDLRLGPGMDGVAVVAALKGRRNGPAALILTTYDNDSDIARAVLAGAAGYLLKDAEPSEIARGVADAAAGYLVLADDLERRMSDRIVQGVPRLSPRELDVLKLVSEGLTNREIAKRLFVTEATVKTHLVHAFGKLEADSRTSAVANAREHGLLE